mmetsp:Transcript_25555/g.58059  ORF Transcript_25555/g.58059 Transcript_25555/m.58059 type:complete len:366 (-) Transcript_25555:643-1740(-)
MAFRSCTTSSILLCIATLAWASMVLREVLSSMPFCMSDRSSSMPSFAPASSALRSRIRLAASSFSICKVFRSPCSDSSWSTTPLWDRCRWPCRAVSVRWATSSTWLLFSTCWHRSEISLNRSRRRWSSMSSAWCCILRSLSCWVSSRRSSSASLRIAVSFSHRLTSLSRSSRTSCSANSIASNFSLIPSMSRRYFAFSSRSCLMVMSFSSIVCWCIFVWLARVWIWVRIVSMSFSYFVFCWAHSTELSLYSEIWVSRSLLRAVASSASRWRASRSATKVAKFSAVCMALRRSLSRSSLRASSQTAFSWNRSSASILCRISAWYLDWAMWCWVLRASWSAFSLLSCCRSSVTSAISRWWSSINRRS